MTQGHAVAASRVGGLQEVREEEKTGRPIPPQSPAAFAEAILRAASERARLCQLGA